jgi:hypothetical protein
MNEVFRFPARPACGIFTGTAVYISLVGPPARMTCGTPGAVSPFEYSYARAEVTQASLAARGCVASASSWWIGGGYGWQIGGILLMSVVPFTLIAILPTNRRLLLPRFDGNSHFAHRLPGEMEPGARGAKPHEPRRVRDIPLALTVNPP